MKYPSGSLFMDLFWNLFCLIWVLLPHLFFSPCPFAWKICFQHFTFSLCRSFGLRCVSCRWLMCRSYLFIIHLPYVFSLGHLIHLHLRLLLIGTYSLPFYSLCTCVPLPLALILLLKAVSLPSLSVLVWWRCILSVFFCLGNSLFLSPSILIESPRGENSLGCRPLLFITWNISCHCLLACCVCVEESASSVIGAPLLLLVSPLLLLRFSLCL